MYEVYRHDQRSTSRPSELIDAKTATYWLDCGFAKRVSRWRLRLTKPLPLKLRDRSANIKESIIHAAIDGNRYCQALIETWS
jgi:hypothetical protein